MQIFCLGLNHHTAPLEVREKFAVPETRLSVAVAELSRTEGLGEAVIVSTCNRVEYYVTAQDGFVGGDLVGSYIGLHLASRQSDEFFQHASADAIRHLFRVVSGLDSMVLGETEILGQVKKAYETAHKSGATSGTLNTLFQKAFNVSKEVRTKTNITRGQVSIGSVAVDLAERIFGRLAQCKVMILGAGETSEMTAGAMKARGVSSVFVANRSYERALALADKMNGKAVHFDRWSEEVHDVDILIGSTAAPHHIITREKLATVMRTRPDRPLFCIDLAVPRDIEPSVNELDGVYLYDIDSLQMEAEHSMTIRKRDVVVCEEIIERHVATYMERLSGVRRPSMRRQSAGDAGHLPTDVWRGDEGTAGHRP